MSSERPSEPPEEPHYRNEPHLLSPASPKPIHFPTPTNIPVLEMQMDVGFNQTEAHMSDPAMHNTDVRPDFWRDPNEQQQQQEANEDASPYSTGGEAAEMAKAEAEAEPAEAEADGDVDADVEAVSAEVAADSKDTTTNTPPSEPVSLSNEASRDATADASMHDTDATIDAATAANGAQFISSDPTISLETSAEETAANPDDDMQAQTNEVEPVPEQTQSASALDNSSSVDVQALLNTLQTNPITSSNAAPSGENLTAPGTDSSAQAQPFAPGLDSSPVSAAGLGAPPSGLPPRPPPQQQPLIHPNYVHSQHIRDYHPHAAHPAFQPTQGHVRAGSSGNTADPSSRSYVPPVAASPSSANPAGEGQTPVGVAGPFTYPPQSLTSATPAGQPMQSPMSAIQPYTSSTPIESRRERKLAAGETPTAEDRPWDATVQRKYDGFIEAERGYVSEGRWEQFPQGSRLFVGNLSSEKVTKRDIFHVFHPYGDLAQISIKQAYGFVQFLRTEDCTRALEGEQGTQIRDKRIHLEVSKPQKNRNQQSNTNNNAGRRSRSPDFGGRGKPPANVDRYVSSGSRNDRNNSRRDGSYRSGGYRSPSPRGGGYRDRYDDRYRARSPDYGRGASRYRSPSPRRNEDDDLPLPKRAPRDVPDVQILVLDSLDRDFISWVEKAFSSRGVRVDVLLLSPRLSEQAVVRRQIVEGVVAVSKLTRANQQTGKIGLQIFDRRQGGAVGNVSFEEYDGLDPAICVELVLRAKSTHAAPPPPPTPSAYGGYGGGAYGAPQQPPPPAQYGYGQQYGSQPPPSAYPPAGAYGQQAPPPPAATGAAPPPNLQNLITSLDPNGLQSLLSAMNQQQHQSPSTPQTGGSSGAYGSTPSSQQQQGFPGQFGQQQAQAMAALQRNPALAGVLQQHQQQQQQQVGGAGQGGGAGGQVNMQDILARLGTYKQ